MLEIRTATLEDVSALASLNEEVQALHVEHRPEEFKVVDPGVMARWFERLIEDPAARVLLAMRGGAVLGYLVLLERVRPETPHCFEWRWWEVDQIGVHASARRQGVARALMEEAVRRAKSAGVAELGLTTWAFNREAQEAFRQLGFEPKTLRFERRIE